MPDKRTVKTVSAIRKAFEQLLIEQNDVMFTIKEITAEAGINRKTFYLHFNCIEDLYNDLEERIEKKLLKLLEQKGFFENRFSIKSFLECLIELIDSKPVLYEKLLVNDNYKFVFRNIKNKIKEQIVSRFGYDIKSLKFDMQAEYAFSGLIKMFRVWVTRKNEMSIEELYKTAYQVIKYGIQQLDI